MAPSRTSLGALVAVMGVAAGCGRVFFDPSGDAGPSGRDAAPAADAGAMDAGAFDAGEVLDAAVVLDSAVALDATVAVDSAVTGLEGGVVSIDASEPPLDGGVRASDAGTCLADGLAVSPGRVAHDWFDVLGGPEPVIVWVAPGSTTISVAGVRSDGSFIAAAPIAGGTPSAPRIARTTTGFAIAWIDAGTVRMVRLTGALVTPSVTVFAADSSYQPSIAALGDVVGLSWQAAARTPSDLWFATVSAAGEVSTPVRMSTSSAGAGPMAPAADLFMVVVPDTAGQELARFTARGVLVGAAPLGSVTPYFGASIGSNGVRTLVAGNFGVSTQVTVLDVTLAVVSELAIALPLDIGSTADSWQGARARGAWAIPRWSSSTTPGRSTIDVAWMALDGTLSPLPRTVIPLEATTSQRVVVADVGDSYLVAWASPFSPDAPLQVRIFCP